MSTPPGPFRRFAGLAVGLVVGIVVVSLLGSCSDDATDDVAAPTTEDAAGSGTSAADGGPEEPLVFNAQGNHLDAYAIGSGHEATPASRRVVESAQVDPDSGRDVNAQICFLERGDDGEVWFVAGEDTDQDEPGGSAGWGIFRLEGRSLDELRATQLAELVPTYQPANDDPENYGCGELADGRVLTTDIGNQAAGEGDGQLIVWFPPLVDGTDAGAGGVAYCKLDVSLPTAQSILVRDDVVYVAAARGDVYRYPGPFPTGPDAAGGCAGTDATGAPLAEGVEREVFIESGANGLATPAGLADAPDGGMYVSSVFTGVINEYGPDGSFRRTILSPPEGEQLGEETYSTGTPLGLGVGPDGTLYYADIGIVVSDGSIGPGEDAGSVRRIRFVDGEPLEPEVLADDLAFPDGIGVWVP